MGDFNQAKYIQEYQKEKYDRCIFNVPKGQREKIKKHYESKGYKSLNQYVNDLIKKDMEKRPRIKRFYATTALVKGNKNVRIAEPNIDNK